MRMASSNWISGVQTLMGNMQAHVNTREQTALEDIRQALLDCMGEVSAEKHPVVQLRVTHAHDLQDLWYLRADVMVAIASQDGESIARGKMLPITDMFNGYLPKGLASRPSPLGG